MATRSNPKDYQQYKSRLLMTLSRHVGRSNRISMGNLYEDVFGEPFADKINGTRGLRRLIQELQNDGVPICSSSDKNAGGYWLASAGSELAAYLKQIHNRAMGLLVREATLRKMTLPELVGQISMDCDAAP